MVLKIVSFKVSKYLKDTLDSIIEKGERSRILRTFLNAFIEEYERKMFEHRKYYSSGISIIGRLDEINNRIKNICYEIKQYDCDLYRNPNQLLNIRLDESTLERIYRIQNLCNLKRSEIIRAAIFYGLSKFYKIKSSLFLCQ